MGKRCHNTTITWYSLLKGEGEEETTLREEETTTSTPRGRGNTSTSTNNSGILSELKHYNEYDKIIVGNGSQLSIIRVENTTRSALKLQEVLGLRLLRLYSQLVNLQKTIVALLNLMKLTLL